MEDAHGNVQVPGLIALSLSSPSSSSSSMSTKQKLDESDLYTEFMRIIDRGMASRAVASNNINDLSSRSHCILIIHVKKTFTCHAHEDSNATAPIKTQTSKLCLVDLAGSERQRKTGAQGTTLKEGQNINKSLMVLGSVVNALNSTASSGAGAASPTSVLSHGVGSSGSSAQTTTKIKSPPSIPPSRIPYRDSKLTRILQDSLGGTAKTAILVCCSPSVHSVSETISSLRFGARARAIESKYVQSNAIMVDTLVGVVGREEGRGGGGAPGGARDGATIKLFVYTSILQALGVLLLLGAEHVLCRGE